MMRGRLNVPPCPVVCKGDQLTCPAAPSRIKRPQQRLATHVDQHNHQAMPRVTSIITTVCQGLAMPLRGNDGITAAAQRSFNEEIKGQEAAMKTGLAGKVVEPRMLTRRRGSGG